MASEGSNFPRRPIIISRPQSGSARYPGRHAQSFHDDETRKRAPRHSGPARYGGGPPPPASYPQGQPPPLRGPVPPLRGPAPPPGIFAHFAGSDSEDENDNNDISLASFDIGSGALVEDLKLKTFRQKANLEAKLSETEPATDPRPLPELSLYAHEGKVTYDATTSYYLRAEGSDSPGDISTHIEYLANLPVSRRRDRSIFRWIHLKHDNMDFDVFSRSAQEMPGLPQDQIQTVSHFLQRVRKDLERKIRSQRGAMGSFMKSGLITKTTPREDSGGGPDRTYVFCCIPYHQLAPYTPLETTTNSRLHPVRTLLQSKHASTPKQRDFEQAVRFLSGTPSNHVFHTSNLWCLIVNNKFMITSASGLSAHEISGDRARLASNVPTQPPSALSFPQSIQVLIWSRVYVIPLSQCDSWFKFTQNFSEYILTLHDDYAIKWKGVKVTAELWPLIIDQAQKEIICVVFSRRKRPITHGIEESVKEGDFDEPAFRPLTPSDGRLSVISEVDSIHSSSSGKNADRDRDNSSPLGSPSHGSKQSSDYLQSPNRTNDKSSPQTTRSSSPTPGIINFREFHVLIWIAIRLGRNKSLETEGPDLNITNPAVKIDETKPKSDRELVNEYLSSVHLWLENQKQKRASTLYRKGTQKSLDDVERAMQGMLKSRLDSPQIDGFKSNLIEAVKSIFSLFLPLEQRNIMCSKFWGALHMAITAEISDEASWQMSAVVSTLLQVAVLANTIKAQLSGGNAPPPKALSMPPVALRVWHQLLLCILFWSPKDLTLSQSHASKCLGLLQKAHQDLMKNPNAKKLEKLEAVLPNGLLAIIISHVINDFTGTQPGLVDSYWEYFGQLEMEADKDPLNRRNQAKTTAFINEVRIVLDSLEQQHTVTDQVNDEFVSQEDGWNRARGIGPLDPAQLLFREALDNLQGKISSIEELLENSEELLEISAEALRHNRDKQEAAIYTFTIVTIIFLPISTVATVLGMNTTDVRNMEQTQWVFWATAIPVTAVVIVVSLYAAGISVWPFKRGGGLSWAKDRTGSGFRSPGETARARRGRARRKKRKSSSSSDSSLSE